MLLLLLQLSFLGLFLRWLIHSSLLLLHFYNANSQFPFLLPLLGNDFIYFLIYLTYSILMSNSNFCCVLKFSLCFQDKLRIKVSCFHSFICLFAILQPVSTYAQTLFFPETQCQKMALLDSKEPFFHNKEDQLNYFHSGFRELILNENYLSNEEVKSISKNKYDYNTSYGTLWKSFLLLSLGEK